MCVHTYPKGIHQIRKFYGAHFEFLKRFEVHKMIGKGAYGVVFPVLQKNTQTVWALKKNYDCFRCKNDAQRAYREVTYLKAMKGNEHIVDLGEIYSAMNERVLPSDVLLYLIVTFTFLNITITFDVLPGRSPF